MQRRGQLDIGAIEVSQMRGGELLHMQTDQRARDNENRRIGMAELRSRATENYRSQ